MWMKRLTYAFGITMTVVMALSVILPAISQNTAQTTTSQPVQPTAIPTFPPPPDPATISFDSTYMHPSGLFTVAEPTGWTVSEPVNTRESARTVMANTSAQSIVQVEVEPLTPSGDAEVATLDDVDAHFDSSWLAGSWREYSSWNESSRQRTDDDRLIIDFELTANGQTFVSRQEAWTDGEWLYSVRVVAPSNATQTLTYVLDGVSESLQPQKLFTGIPFSWPSYYDTTDQHIIRYPADWTVSDSAPGRPASINGQDAILRVETLTEAVADEADATAWVENLRNGVEVLSIQPITRADATGYAVAYSAPTVDGDTESGLAVLLNGADGRTHVANGRVPGAVDLNSADAPDTYYNVIAALESFVVLPDAAVTVAETNTESGE